jgi:hypothetical protein
MIYKEKTNGCTRTVSTPTHKESLSCGDASSAQYSIEVERTALLVECDNAIESFARAEIKLLEQVEKPVEKEACTGKI